MTCTRSTKRPTWPAHIDQSPSLAEACQPAVRVACDEVGSLMMPRGWTSVDRRVRVTVLTAVVLAVAVLSLVVGTDVALLLAPALLLVGRASAGVRA